jgi:hypothetical protein
MKGMDTFGMHTVGMAVLVVAAATPAFCQPNLGASVSGDLFFGGARLGMSLSQWQALPRPRGSTAGVSAACGNDSAPIRGSKASLSASTPAPREVVCSYASRLGRYVVAQDFPLTKTYLARDPTFTFVSGRLAKIEFGSSIDAFDDLVAAFETKFGRASQTIRDQIKTPYGPTLPRVQKIWRLPDGVVRITDPSTRLDQLLVDIARPGEDRPAGLE